MTLLENTVPGVSGPAPATYEQFWAYYVSQHLHPATRRIHVLATLAGLGCVALTAVLHRARPALAAPVLGYGPAWFSHFRIERNKPASFGHPLWSARADFRLLRRHLAGTLERDVRAVRDALGIPDACETLSDLRTLSGDATESEADPTPGRRVDRHDGTSGAALGKRGQQAGDAGRPPPVSPKATPDRSGEPLDLGSFLADRRDRIEQLAERYFTTDSFARRGGYVELLVQQLSNLTATRSEILRPVLRELADGEPYLARFDQYRQRQVDILAQLDELTIGVGPRDVHQHQPERLVELVRALRGEIQTYDRYEANDLLPFLEARLDTDRLRDLGRAARRASRIGPTHAHPKRPPADERSFFGKRVSTFYDRLRNVAEHPERTVETGGEEGP